MPVATCACRRVACVWAARCASDGVYGRGHAHQPAGAPGASRGHAFVHAGSGARAWGHALACVPWRSCALEIVPGRRARRAAVWVMGAGKKNLPSRLFPEKKPEREPWFWLTKSSDYLVAILIVRPFPERLAGMHLLWRATLLRTARSLGGCGNRRCVRR